MCGIVPTSPKLDLSPLRTGDPKLDGQDKAI